MTLSQRNILRLVVPPLLALGLVAVVTDPMDAADAPVVTALMSAQSPAAVAVDQSPTTSVTVSIPPVSLAREVRSVDGKLHTPVLLADPTVTGSASVMPGNRCAVPLVQGVVSWLTCDAVPGSVVRVMLSDGRVFQTRVR
jgi:hypothetical protein